MAVTITRTAWTDDDGSGTTGTVINNAEKTTLYGQIDTALALAVPTVSTVTTTGTIAALALPTGGGNLVIYMNNASLATIQGIAAGATGQLLTIVSMGAGQVDLAHQNASATAANRLINFATSGSTSLAAGSGVATYEYDAATARWRLIAHEQGAWITPTYAGGNFTGNASMTWTVDSGDVSTCEYYLRGRMLTVNWYLTTTSVGGTVSSALQIANAAWGSYTATKITTGSTSYSDNGASQTPGFCQIAAAATVIQNFKQGLASWTLATNTTTATGSIAFEVN